MYRSIHYTIALLSCLSKKKKITYFFFYFSFFNWLRWLSRRQSLLKILLLFLHFSPGIYKKKGCSCHDNRWHKCTEPWKLLANDKNQKEKKKWAKFSRHGVVTWKLKNYSQRDHVLRLPIENSVSIRLKRKRKKDSLTKSTTTWFLVMQVITQTLRNKSLIRMETSF